MTTARSKLFLTSAGVAVVVVVILFAVMGVGCADGHLAVSGKLADSGCEMSLWARLGPFWSKKSPAKVATATVSREFHVNWLIGGPKQSHWIEISCPGGRAFRSIEFDAPTLQTIKLGDVVLTDGALH